MVTMKVTTRRHGFQAVVRRGTKRLYQGWDADIGTVQRRALAWCRAAGIQLDRILLEGGRS